MNKEESIQESLQDRLAHLEQLLEEKNELSEAMMETLLKQIKELARQSQASQETVEKASEVTVRVGTDMLFTYPDALEDFDKLRKLEIYPNGCVKITEYSTLHKRERRHFIFNADIISWV